jgi:hypothetical protein
MNVGQPDHVNMVDSGKKIEVTNVQYFKFGFVDVYKHCTFMLFKDM